MVSCDVKDLVEATPISIPARVKSTPSASRASELPSTLQIATVRLPRWFGALNRDFRYQLTPIGQLVLAAVVRPLAHNRFTIETSKPHVEVSWQVTGVRHDAFARAHPLRVETDK